MTEEATIYYVDDLKRIHKCGRDKAYDLMRSKGFPSMRWGRTYIVTKDNLESWLCKYAGKQSLI